MCPSPGAGTFSVRNAETEVFDRILLVTEKIAVANEKTALSLKKTKQKRKNS